jgi:ABC-type uncharacterized transport system permease subunit
VPSILVVSLYLAASALAAYSAWRTSAAAAGPLAPAGPALAVLAVVAHLAWLTHTLSATGLAFDIADSLSMFGTVVGAIGALLAFRRVFRAPAALLLVTGGLLSLGTGRMAPIREVTGAGWPLAAHITLSALAFGLLAAAAVLALVLAAQDHSLRNRRPAAWLAALPPVESMERALFTVLGLGFVALSLTLLVGFVFVTDLLGQRLVHKVVLAMTAWVIFGWLLLGRHRFGWRGRRARRLVLIGFGVLAMSYFVTKFVLEVLLGRHWG